MIKPFNISHREMEDDFVQALAYEGYFNNGRFYSSGKVMHIPEKRRVFITILDESESTENAKAIEQKESAQEWLDDLLRILQDDDKELDENDFPRINFCKRDELFAGEENL